MRWLVASWLLVAVFATLPEIHRDDHAAVSAFDQLADRQIVLTDLHPDRPAPCLERAVVKTIPRCPACQLRIQSGGDALQRPAMTARLVPSDRLVALASTSAFSADGRPPSSRGPPGLL